MTYVRVTLEKLIYELFSKSSALEKELLEDSLAVLGNTLLDKVDSLVVHDAIKRERGDYCQDFLPTTDHYNPTSTFIGGIYIAAVVSKESNKEASHKEVDVLSIYEYKDINGSIYWKVQLFQPSYIFYLYNIDSHLNKLRNIARNLNKLANSGGTDQIKENSRKELQSLIDLLQKRG